MWDLLSLLHEKTPQELRPKQVNSVPGGERLDRRATGDDLGSEHRHNLMTKRRSP